mmetsp:Transcript_39509/g.117509  ORF Transcript_39509/g.117509 Transcript_39509/m.117509 type:complete len:214 (-) Transcript_39509:1512-2153(-)
MCADRPHRRCCGAAASQRCGPAAWCRRQLGSCCRCCVGSGCVRVHRWLRRRTRADGRASLRCPSYCRRSLHRRWRHWRRCRSPPACLPAWGCGGRLLLLRPCSWGPAACRRRGCRLDCPCPCRHHHREGAPQAARPGSLRCAAARTGRRRHGKAAAPRCTAAVTRPMRRPHLLRCAHQPHRSASQATPPRASPAAQCDSKPWASRQWQPAATW